MPTPDTLSATPGASLPDFAALLARGFQEEAVVLSAGHCLVSAGEPFLARRSLVLAEIQGKSCQDLALSCLPICRNSLGECPLREVRATGEKASVTVLDDPAGPGTRHSRVDVYPVPGTDGALPLFLVVSRDISAQVAEERLKEQMWMEILSRMEQLYAAMVASGEAVTTTSRELTLLTETLPLAMVWWDRDGRIIRLNTSAEILFGAPAAELVGRPFASFFASGTALEKFTALHRNILKGQSLGYTLCENRTSEGRLVTGEWFHAAQTDGETGKVTGCLSMGQDATERVELREQLTRVRTTLDALQAITGEGVVTVNSLGRITGWNPGAEKLFGWSGQAILGREVETLVEESGQETLRAAYQEMLTAGRLPEGRRETLEILCTARDGRILPARVTILASAAMGRPALFFVFRDLSEARHTERFLIRSERARTLGEMADGVAHDMNNLLAVILANLQLLRQGAGSRDLGRSAHLDAAEDAARQGAARVAALLAFGQREPAEGDHLFVPRQLPPLIRETLEVTSARWKDCAQKNGHAIAVDPDLAEVPEVRVHEAEFKEMLANILFNAVEAMPAGGCIHVALVREEGGVVLRVADNGEGIAAVNLPRVCEPLFTTRGAGHAGMGLHVARRIAKRHGGRLAIESLPGMGTTVSIHLPLLTAVGADLGGEAASAGGNALRILVIDDEPAVRQVIREILAQAGHEAEIAEDGREGIRRFRERAFDLVLTDRGMPGMGGIETAERLRRLAPELPILLVTGWGEEDQGEPLAPGAVDAILGKPFAPERLLTAVNRAWRGRKKTAEPGERNR